MKRALVILILTTLCCDAIAGGWMYRKRSVASGGSSVDPALIYWLRMDAPTNCCGGWNAPDSSIHAAPGTQTNVAGRPLQIALLAEATNGFRYNGSTHYMDYGTFPTVPPTGFTFCAWVKSTASTYVNVGGSYHYAGANEAGFYARAQAANGGTWAAGSLGIRLVTDLGAAKVLHTGSTVVFDGNWHHFAFTQAADGNSHSLYIDGGATYYTNDANTFVMIYANNHRFSVGALPDDSGTPSWFGHWPGDIDDVRVYDHELASNEVVAITSEAPGASR